MIMPPPTTPPADFARQVIITGPSVGSLEAQGRAFFLVSDPLNSLDPMAARGAVEEVTANVGDMFHVTTFGDTDPDAVLRELIGDHRIERIVPRERGWVKVTTYRRLTTSLLSAALLVGLGIGFTMMEGRLRREA